MNQYSWFGGIYDEPKNMFPNFAIDPETVGEMWPDYHIDPRRWPGSDRSATPRSSASTR